jgi:glycosyltransferase involved in cell wall biosynthesis
MPNGSDVTAVSSDYSLELGLREKLELPDDVPVLLYCGRMMWYKGISLKLKALELLYKRGIKFRMIFVGDGEDLDEIKAKVA